MNNLSNLTITNREFDLNTGFFWVEFENGKSLQCCLKQEFDLDNEGNEVNHHYVAEIDESDCGYDEGICAENNEWALDGENDWDVNQFLMEQAREVGLQIVA